MSNETIRGNRKTIPTGWYVLDDTTRLYVKDWRGNAKPFRSKQAAERRATAIERLGHLASIHGHGAGGW